MRTKGSWRKAVTWTFPWWASVRLSGRHTDLLRALLAEMVNDHLVMSDP